MSARAPLSESDIAPLLAAAEHFGLPVDPQDILRRGAVWGDVQGARLALGVRFLAGRPAGYAHFAEAKGPVLGPVTVEPWTGRARGRQITGDARTDAALAVHGEPKMVRGWLDAETRARLVALFEPLPRPLSVQLAGRRATFRGPETLAISPDRIIADAAALLQLVDAARLGRALLDRVVHNALEDPEPEVREHNAALLGELIPAADMDGRFGAATRLLFSDRITIDHRLDVLRLVRALPPNRVAPLMIRLLEEGPIELARRAVGWAGDGARVDAVRPLLRLLRRFDDSSLTRAVVMALGEIGDARAQPALMKLLDREEDALREAVVRALGQLGTQEALAAIEPFTKGLFTDRALKRAAREATEDIQVRITGVFEVPNLDDQDGS